MCSLAGDLRVPQIVDGNKDCHDAGQDPYLIACRRR